MEAALAELNLEDGGQEVEEDNDFVNEKGECSDCSVDNTRLTCNAQMRRTCLSPISRVRMMKPHSKLLRQATRLFKRKNDGRRKYVSKASNVPDII